MKRRVSVCLLAFAAVLAGTAAVLPASAEEANSAAGAEFYLAEFVTAHPLREAGSPGETAAAEYLAERYRAFGYLPLGAEMIVPFERDEVPSRNVLAVKPAAEDPETAKYVLLSAHYDNASDGMPAGYQGASDNGSGVATLLAVADGLREVALPFHVIFANFGAEESGMLGAQAFYESRSVRPEDLLVAINFDVVGGGKHLYLYTDEVDSSYDAYFRRIAADIGVELRDNPANKKVTVPGAGKFPYAHEGMMSDHLVFLSYGIPTAFLFSYDWEDPALGLTEGGPVPLMHAAGDNLANLPETYAGHMGDAARLVSAWLRDPDFVGELTHIDAWDYSVLLGMPLSLGLFFGVFTLGVLFVVIRYVTFRNPPPEPPADEEPTKPTVFDGFE